MSVLAHDSVGDWRHDDRRMEPATALLRAIGAHTLEALHTALAAATDAIDPPTRRSTSARCPPPRGGLTAPVRASA
jgi:hypothetical protein